MKIPKTAIVFATFYLAIFAWTLWPAIKFGGLGSVFAILVTLPWSMTLFKCGSELLGEAFFREARYPLFVIVTVSAAINTALILFVKPTLDGLIKRPKAFLFLGLFLLGLWLLPNLTSKFSRPQSIRSAKEGITSAVLWTPDGAQLVAGYRDGTVRIQAPNEEKETFSISAHRLPVDLVAIDSSNNIIATAAKDKLVKIWKRDSGKLLREVSVTDTPCQCMEFSPVSPLLAIGHYKNVLLINYETGETIRDQALQGFTVANIHFSPDGKLLFSSSISGEHGIRSWDVATGQEIFRFGDRHRGSSFLTLSTDGRTLLTHGDRYGLTLWNTETGKEVSRYGAVTERFRRAVFSKDGTKILAETQNFPGRSQLKVFDVETTKELSTIGGRFQESRSLDPSPIHGRIVATATDGTVSILEFPPTMVDHTP